MRASGVVKADPFSDPHLGLLPVGIALQIDVLVLQRPPQAFDEDVIHPAAATIHRDPDSGRRQHAREGGAGELASLVGIEDLRPTEPRQRFLERRDAERTSMVLDKRQASTARLAQSITATR